MVGLGSPLGVARVVVWAEAIWLKGMIRAAVATARAGMMRRSLACCAARAMFTVISFSGECRASVRSHGEALTGKSPVSTVWQETGSGYPQRHCTSVNGARKLRLSGPSKLADQPSAAGGPIGSRRALCRDCEAFPVVQLLARCRVGTCRRPWLKRTQTALAQRAALVEWNSPRGERFGDLKEIRQPTLVANGNHDITLPTINSYILAQNIPHAELIIHPLPPTPPDRPRVPPRPAS